MRIVLTISFILSYFIVFPQNFYQANGKKHPFIGEQARLVFTNDVVLPLHKNVTTRLVFPGSLISELLPSLIDLGTKITSEIIENRLKKYSSKFSARNTFIDTTHKKYISRFDIQRQIILKDKIEKKLALNIGFIPIKTDDNAFTFAIDKFIVNYSGAKTKKNFNFNDYSIEIIVSYLLDNERVEKKSEVISLQLYDLNSEGNKFPLKDGNGDYLYYSNKFPLIVNNPISDISVNIVETNTAKIKLEKFKSAYENYVEKDGKNISTTIINYYKDKKDTKSTNIENGDE
mgnify:CR=1 FL=1